MALTFQKVKPSARRAKVLLLGEAGSGKTHLALTFPKPAVIDAEGSINWFADRFDFVAVPTKSYQDVRAIIAQARTGAMPGETLVIDSLTSIYNGLLNAAATEREDLRPLDWGRIKRKFSTLLDELYHTLPMHVVCIGWIKPEYAKAGDVVNGKTVSSSDLIKTGETFDGDRKALYAFDFVIKMEVVKGKYYGTVLKTRSGGLQTGARIENFSWKTIEPLLGQGENTYHGMTDEEQIANDRKALAEDDPPQRVDVAEAPAKSYTQLKALFDTKGLPISFNDWLVECVAPDLFVEWDPETKTGRKKKALYQSEARIAEQKITEIKPPDASGKPLEQTDGGAQTIPLGPAADHAASNAGEAGNPFFLYALDKLESRREAHA
jgi:hypothetical protein